MNNLFTNFNFRYFVAGFSMQKCKKFANPKHTEAETRIFAVLLSHPIYVNIYFTPCQTTISWLKKMEKDILLMYCTNFKGLKFIYANETNSDIKQGSATQFIT